MATKLTVVAILVALATVAYAQAQLGGTDQTRVAGTSGAVIVEAVTHAISDSCVFPNDHRFLRRLAFVKTADGTWPDTYRLGFDGGIWQVSQQDFLETKTSSLVSAYWDPIYKASGINWSQVSWADLRKPLYSGIAQMLVLIKIAKNAGQLTNGGDFQRTSETQAQFYQNFMRSGMSGEAYSFLQKANNLTFACGTDRIDLAFLVDDSSSLSPDDFYRSKDFAAKIVKDSNVGPGGVRIAFVTFSTGIRTSFDFSQYTSPASAAAAIKSVDQKLGNTDTHVALGFAADTLFTAASGSRADSVKIAILLTDGVASDELLAQRNAEKLRSKGVTLFVIGLGTNLQSDQLTRWASQPSCTHVQRLDQYAELDTLQAEIRQVSCQTAVMLPSPTQGHPIHVTYACGKSNSFQISSPIETTITIRPRTGYVQVFGSYSFSKPSSAIKDFEGVASVNRPVQLYIRDTTTPLFLTIQSDPFVTGQCGSDYDLDIMFGDDFHKLSEKVCVDKGIVRQCTPLDLLRALYQVNQILPANLGFTNPCINQFGTVQSGYGYHIHPYSQYQFVYCDGRGNIFVVDCNANQYYMDSARDCVVGSPTVITPRPTQAPYTYPITQRPTQAPYTYPITQRPTQRPYTPGPTNPTVTITSGGLCSMCTTANWNLDNRFFPYAGNETLYIMCTEYAGVCKVKQCADFHKWNQRHLACVYTDIVLDYTKNIYQTSPSNLFDLCPAGRTDADILFHPHPADNSKFFHCDEFGNAFIQDCPVINGAKEVWNQVLMTCVPGQPLIG